MSCSKTKCSASGEAFYYKVLKTCSLVFFAQACLAVLVLILWLYIYNETYDILLFTFKVYYMNLY